MKKIFTYLLSLQFALLVMVRLSYAQQDAQFSQYMFNSFYYNPAVAGVDGKANFFLTHRTQWLGYSASFDEGGSPQTQMFSAMAPFVFVTNTGVGLHVVRDVRGPFTSLEAQLSANYHFSVFEDKAKLSVGVRGGVYSQTVNGNLFRFVDDSDAVAQYWIGRRETALKPDLAFGLWYRQEDFYVGLTGNHLLGSRISFGLDNLIDNALARNLYVTGGYNYPLNDQWLLQPSVMIKTIPEATLKTTSVEVSVLGTYNQKFWGGLSFRQSDALIAMIGMYPLKDNSMRVGYAFDYTISGRQGKAPTSHEVFLSYGLAWKRYGKPTPETPRHGTRY